MVESIFGNHRNERISRWIKEIVLACSRDAGQIDEDQSKLQNDKEKLKFSKSRALPNDCKLSSTAGMDDKTLVSMFYLYLMSVDKNIILLLNTWNNEWLVARQAYDNLDQIIQTDNINRRIPENIGEEGK